MRASLPARLLAAALAALIVVPVVPAAPVAAAGDPTTTTIASTVTAATFPGAATVTASVIPDTATGQVEFSVDGGPGQRVDLGPGAVAELTLTGLGAGDHTVVADYLGDATFDVSRATPDPLTFSIDKASQATLQVVATSPAAYGTSQVLSTTGGSGNGAVGFDDGASTACVVAGSSLTITAGSGTCAVVATKAGDANFVPTTSAPLGITVTKATQAIAFTSAAPSPAIVGGTYSPTATATSGNPVAFTIDASTSARCSISGGVVTFTAAGACTINADQAGDGNWDPAPRATQSFGVGQAATTTAVQSSKSPSTYGESVTFTATVAPATATGTVTISDGATTLGACALAAGSCAIATGAVRAGTRSIVATYGGDANHAGSASSPLEQVVDPKALTVTGITAANKVYDGTTAAALTTTGSVLVGVVGGDSVTLVTTGANGTFADKNIGTGKTVTVAGLVIAGADAGNYALTQPTATANITARSMTVTATGVDKVYDKTTAATVTLASAQLVVGDAVDLTYVSATFSPNGNVGTSKPISVGGIAKNGPDAGNYALANTTATTSASILPRPLVMTVTAQDKTYDGTTAATATGTLDDVIPGDRVNRQVGAASFSDENAGTGKTVTATGLAISGPESNQYTLTNTTATDTADITPRALTITAAGVNKVYDGTTAATVTLADNRVTGDAITLGYTAAQFADANVGAAKPVSVTGITVTGTDAGNYTWNATAATTASITAVGLTVTADPKTKTYGEADPPLTYQVTGTLVGADALTGSLARVAGENVGARAITQGTLSAGPNYAIAFTGASLTITPRPITVRATPTSKVYDGTTASLAVPAITSGSLASSDTAAFAQVFADRNVGPSKTLTPGGAVSDGNGGSNYAVTWETATGSITARTLTVVATGQSRVYDGTAAAAVSLSDNRVPGDALTLGYGAAAFADKNVGTGKLVAVTGITVSGADAGNYSWSTTAATTATITARALAVTATGVDKVYDGTATATVTLSDNRVPGDVLTLGHTNATFATKHVGPGKTVSVTGITVTGTDAGNYSWNTATTATASITPRPITVTAVPSTKTYDGNTTSTAIPVVTAGDVVAGDAAVRTQAFDTRIVGSGKTLTPAIQIVDGNNGGNYQVTAVATTTGVIEPKTLTVTGVTAASKVYDGTTTAAVSAAGATLVGRVGADVVALVTTGATGTFSTKDVGTGKTVTVAGLGLTGGDAPNYALTQPTTVASITKAALTVRAGGSRPYGSANPSPLPVTYTGFVGGETGPTAGISGSPTCSTTASSTSIIGSYPTTCSVGTLSAVNYSFTMAADGVFTVTPAPLALAADPKSRQYGTADPAFTATASGFVLGQTAALLAGAPTCSSTVPVAADVGTYPASITCAPGTLAAPNYAFTGPNVPGTLTVVPAVAPPAVTSSVNPAAATADVTFTASVAWPVGSPTGTVTFFEGATDLSGPIALVGGAATFTTSWPAAATEDGDVHEVVAVYSGNGGNFAQAAAAPFRQVVGRSPVEVVVTDTPAKWETNVPVAFTADVHPLGSGVSAPVTGTVEFRVDGALKATVAVVDGRATFATKLALGARTVAAAFTPDVAAASVFRPGASVPLARTVVANTVNASGVGLSSSSVYPVRDSWKDTVAIRGTRNERASVAISVYSPTGSRVRSVSIATGSGPYTYSWNGRNSSGSILAAGKYRVVQVVRDAYGARKTYTSYVTLSRRKMTWYSRTITVAAGPRRFSVAGDASIQSQYSTTSTRALTLSNPVAGQLKWLAVGYQFTLPSASTYTSLSFQVQGSWTGTTAPKIGLVPWSSGDWFKAMYSATRARASMDSITTDWDAHTLTNLSGIRSGRYVRAVIDSFNPAMGSGYAAGPYRYTITGVRLVVKYGILN